MSRVSRRSVGLVLAFPLAAIAGPAVAQDEITLPPIVVSASQVPVAASKTGSAVTVVTAEDIAQHGDRTLAETLRRVPGVSVSQSGSSGGITQVRVRGGDTNHLLVLIDGVEVNNPSDGAFDFADFLTFDVDRVEILRGPQSGIYGANAHSGVISITTKTGRGLDKPVFEAFAEGGSRKMLNGGANLRGSAGPIYGSLTASGYRTDGYNISHNGDEKDPANARKLSMKMGADISDNFNIELIGRHEKRFMESDVDDFATGELVDAHNGNHFTTDIGRVSATFKALDNRLVQTSSLEAYRSRYTQYLTDPTFGAQPPFEANQNRVRIDHKASLTLDSNLFGGERNTFSVLIDHEREHYDTTYFEGTHRKRTGLAGEWLTELPFGLTLSSALRQDWNDTFKDPTTWRFTASQRIAATGSRLHGSVGRGVTNPSFVDQFGVNVFPASNFIGNPDLKPESSIGWDAGLEQTFLDGVLITDVTYFSSNFKDKIETSDHVPGTSCPVDSTLVCPINVDGTTKRRGVEITASLNPWDWLSLTGSYTYVWTRLPDGEDEARTPRNLFHADVTARFLDGRLRTNVGVTYNGKQYDDNFVIGRVELGHFTTVSARVEYDLTKETTVFARAENVFDEDYEEVYSYRAPGFAAYGGVRVRFGADAPASPAP